jgi:hypothetical protein
LRRNTYNRDEKGFLIGMITKMRRVFNRKMYEDGYLKEACQGGKRDWITVLVTICADRTSLPPGVIYQGKSCDVNNAWIEDFQLRTQSAFFAVSPNGWTNDKLGLNWPEKFNRARPAEIP